MAMVVAMNAMKTTTTTVHWIRTTSVHYTLQHGKWIRTKMASGTCATMMTMMASSISTKLSSVSNPDQADADEDGAGDLCDVERDGWCFQQDDNCPLVRNSNQMIRIGWPGRRTMAMMTVTVSLTHLRCPGLMMQTSDSDGDGP